MDPDLCAKFQATPRNVPFILHAAEGLDENSADEIFALDRMQALDDRTVLVHGLGLTSDGISLLNRRGAALVWCPTSNQFLFGQTRRWESLATINNLVLGSDSPLTAAGDLLDEIRFAHVKTRCRGGGSISDGDHPACRRSFALTTGEVLSDLEQPPTSSQFATRAQVPRTSLPGCLPTMSKWWSSQVGCNSLRMRCSSDCLTS